ncbi:hypothetical protein IMX26_08825 [Clostridium sp. 'deep sea']|uniref:hypothetical protein n=1 Tax=Clostridium sp. 'deep sea' TaxID=2779445 RepID=UPI0018966FDF|nr:hypothetical protein [Clostridium sp. 'deep sea']QOR33612.1 hypothetical protein IMX26_08825 [Clostridium sp. 'deep sea']
MVYINNVTDNMIQSLAEGLKNFLGFAGLVVFTYTSLLKEYCSHILCGSFIKCGNKIIMGHEDDRSIDENVNIYSYPFEENGFHVRSIPLSLYGVLLTYKIERLFDEDLKDICFSINAINDDVKNFNNLSINIDDRKLNYLKVNKTDILKRIELLNIDSKELEMIIKTKIRNNYIFNLEFLEDYNVSKFNVLVEFDVKNGTETKMYKVLIALEYCANEEELRLITLY